MIRIGICAGTERLEEVASIGFDYLETSLSGLAQMDERAYEELTHRVDESPIRIEACNGMLPGRIRVTGNDVSASVQHQYLQHAFSRARRLGCETVVFGSSGSRNVQPGFDYGTAYRQINNFLRLTHGHAQDFGIRVAIEPLRRHESNILNLVSEANQLASLLQLPTIGVLGDTYHMEMNSEPFDVFSQAGIRLLHVHTANALGRKAPRRNDGEDYRAIFTALKNAGYDGRISIEGVLDDFAKDAREGLICLKEARMSVFGE